MEYYKQTCKVKVPVMKKLGRNDSCHCGSGLKYKKCCLNHDEAGNITRIAAPQSSSLNDIIDMFEWPNEIHRTIAQHFIQNTIQSYKLDHITFFVSIWSEFSIKELPAPKKLGAFPAALENVMCQTFEYNNITQKELAEKYNISASTLSQRTNQIFHFLAELTESFAEPSAKPFEIQRHSSNAHMSLEQEMLRLHSLLEEQDFDNNEDINEFLEQNINSSPSKKKKASKQEQASELLYQAWNEPNPQRGIKLAQEALLIDPHNGDAYNVLASYASSSKEMAYYYKQGMQIEEQRLGDAFFTENKGYFWGIPSTRPYMRAKHGYAQACADMDKMPEAIQHYRELLELNPNDNQGIRDLLLPAYIETMDFKAAKQLIEQYSEDDSAVFAYSRVLIEYGLNGKSAKLTSLIKKAANNNPFVPAYLRGEKQLPRALPEFIGLGDDQEAIVYAAMNRHLWLTRPELLQLLPKRRK